MVDYHNVDEVREGEDDMERDDPTTRLGWYDVDNKPDSSDDVNMDWKQGLEAPKLLSVIWTRVT